MSTITRRIEEAIESGRAKNYADLANLLHVTPAAVTEWRKERSAPNEDQAAALSELLGKPEVLAECMAARAKRPETRAIWERAARTLSMTMGFAFVAANLFFAPSPAEDTPAQEQPKSLICIM